jgi:O-antigen ligase
MKNGILFYLMIVGVFLQAILHLLGWEDIPLTLFQITFIGSFVFFIGYKIVNDDFEIHHNNYTLILLVFLSLIFLSLIYSDDRMNGFINATRFLVLLVFVGLLTNLVASRKHVIRGLIVISVLCVILSMMSVMESLLNPEVVIQNFLSQGAKLNRSAAGGIYDDPNRFAASLFIPLAFGFSVMNSRLDNKYRVAGGILFLVILGGIVTSYSRSGFLGVVMICVLNIYLFRKYKPFLVLGSVAFVIILSLPSLRMTMFSYSERILDLLAGAGDDSSNIRVLLGFASIEMLLDSYGLGVGFDAFGDHFTSYYSVQKTLGVVEPHNITYTILAELGVQGFFIFVVLLFLLFRDSIVNVRNSRAEVDKIISITLLSSFFGYILFYQFYGGALFDTALMLNIGMMLSHKNILGKLTDVAET